MYHYKHLPIHFCFGDEKRALLCALKLIILPIYIKYFSNNYPINYKKEIYEIIVQWWLHLSLSCPATTGTSLVITITFSHVCKSIIFISSKVFP